MATTTPEPPPQEDASRGVCFSRSHIRERIETQEDADETLVPDARDLVRPSEAIDARLAQMGVVKLPDPTRGPAA